MYNACFNFGRAGLKGCKWICQRLRSRSEGYERQKALTVAKTWEGYGKNMNFVGKNFFNHNAWSHDVLANLSIIRSKRFGHHGSTPSSRPSTPHPGPLGTTPVSYTHLTLPTKRIV